MFLCGIDLSAGDAGVGDVGDDGAVPPRRHGNGPGVDSVLLGRGGGQIGGVVGDDLADAVGAVEHPVKFAATQPVPELDGSEALRLHGLDRLKVGMNPVLLEIRRTDGRCEAIALGVCIDTTYEIDYLTHGGTLPYVIRKSVQAN